MGVEWKAVSHKRKCLKVWKTKENRDAYQAAERASNLAVHIAKSDAARGARDISSKVSDAFKLHDKSS